jgi:hypothetical protein
MITNICSEHGFHVELDGCPKCAPAAAASPGVSPVRDSLVELVAAMERYEADATEPAPAAHIQMMHRARAALRATGAGQD